ncbi:cytochrome P450 71A1 [Lolium perenne]|uniref:cytochrome P450 71A1 n=1 Tax=Lolium perenne TaxID=4522 RepID=UPI0021EAC884|nr:cytochrome P450 71A1-like [Lolium perenne]
MASLDQLDSTLALSLLFVVSCFFVLVIVKGKGGNRNAPPSPPALPVIGNLHQLGSGHLHRRLQALAQRHGPLFLLRLGSVPTLVVSSAPMAEAVLRAQDHVFCSRPQQYTARGTLYGCRDIAFSPYGDRWRQLRRIAVVHLLSAKRVDSFHTVRKEEVASFVERIRALASGAIREDEGVNVTELIVDLTNTVISRASFGYKLGGMEPGMIHDVMKEVSGLLGVIAISDMFPWLWWMDWATGLDARVKRTVKKLDGILNTILAEHERIRGGNDGEAPDLLDDLLSILKDGDHGFKLDRIDVKALILDMFLAGTDTPYKTIEWAMAELMKNPREMEKVQAEVRQVAQAHGGVHEEDLGKMSMLHAAIKEALRLHPPVPLLTPRETIQDTRLHGYDIQARSRVLINAWAIGRDNESWENATEFRPERFLGTVIDYSGKDPRFIPFGAGRRGCPGTAFGTRLVELTLANMMYHFDWKLPDGQDPESFELLESKGFSPGLKSALILAVKTL